MNNTQRKNGMNENNNDTENIRGNMMIPPFIPRFTNFLLVFVFAMIILLANLIKYPDVTKETALMCISDSSGKEVKFRLKAAFDHTNAMKEGNELTFLYMAAGNQNTIKLKGTVLKVTALPQWNEVVAEGRIAEGIVPAGTNDIWGELETRTGSRSLMERLINNYLNKYLKEKQL